MHLVFPKELVLAILLLVPVTAVIEAARPNEADDRAASWHDSFEEAAKESQRLKVPLLIHFFAEWCQPCRRMERDVLNESALIERFGQGLVAVKVNAEDREQLVRRFDVRALPADVVVGPDGTVLSRTHGYQSKQEYLDRLSMVGDRFQSTRRTQPARQNRGAPRRHGQTRRRAWRDFPARPAVEINPSDQEPSRMRQLPKSNPPADAFGSLKPPLGLDGYSPVSLWQHRKWEKGSPKYSAVYKGVAYRLASRAEYRQFTQNPSRFAPRLLGCDPVLLWETDRAVPGSVLYGAYFDGELFLFVSEKTRARFRRNPQRYARTRHVLHLKDVQRNTGR